VQNRQFFYQLFFYFQPQQNLTLLRSLKAILGVPRERFAIYLDASLSIFVFNFSLASFIIRANSSSL
jgi:hypothetical protein